MSSIIKTLLTVGDAMGGGVPLAKESAVLKAAKAKLGLGIGTPPPKPKRTKAQVTADAIANKARKAAEQEEARVLREQVAADKKAAKLESEGFLAAGKLLDTSYKRAMREYSRATVDFQNLHNKALKQGYLTDKQLDVLKGHYSTIETHKDTLNNLQRGGYEGTFPKQFELPPNSFNPSSYKRPKPKPPGDEIPNPVGDIGYGDKNTPGYRSDEDIDINAKDNPAYKQTPADMEARAKHKKTLEEINQQVMGSQSDTEWGKRMSHENDVFGRDVSKAAAFVDQLSLLVGQENAGRVLSDAARGTNTSAVHYQQNFVLETESKLQEMKAVFNKALDISAFSVLSKDKYSANLTKIKELKQGLTERLLINAQEFREGKVISMTSDFDIQSMVDEYVKSGLAPGVSKKLHDAGIIKAEDTNPFSIPVKHAYTAIQSRIEAGIIAKEDYFDMIGDQLVSLNPNFTSKKYKPRDVGKAFYNKLEDRLRNGNSKHFTPESSGDPLLDETLNQLFFGSSDFSTKLNLDFKKVYTSPTTGKTFKLSDFIDVDVFENIRAYNHRGGGLYGLVKSGLLVEVPEQLLTISQKAANLAADSAGKARPLHLKTITSEADFERWTKSYLDNIPLGEAYKEAQEVFDNTLHLLMGRAPGEEVAAGFKAANTLAATIFLKNSGVLNIFDSFTQAFFFGGLSVLGSLVAALPAGKFWNFVGKNMTKAEAEESIAFLQAARRASAGNTTSFAHFMGNEAYKGNKIYEAIGAMGDKTTWFNMSEWVRRMQLYTVARTLDSEMAKLAQGVGQEGRKSLSHHLREAGVPQEMIDKWGEAIRKFGHDTRKWSAEYHPERLEVELGSLMDRIILGVYAGELPGFLANSSVGKALLPFLSATFALHNKLFRYTSRRGGFAMAELLAYQAPGALAITYLKEVASGRNPEDLTTKQLIFGFLTNMSGLGSLTLLLNLVTQDGGRGLQFSSAATGFPNRVAQVLLKGSTGEADMRDLLAVMPLLAVNPVLNTLTGKVFFPD